MTKLENMLASMRNKSGNEEKHQALVDEIYARQCAKYGKQYCHKNVLVYRGVDAYLEMDNLVTLPNYWIVVEVKSCSRPRKARKQLNKILKHYDDVNVKSYYVTPYEVKRYS